MNEGTREDFTARFGFLFEHTPQIVAAVADQRPFSGPEALHAALVKEACAMDDAAQLALLRAHPQLADKAAIAQGLTKESASEQASAGLDRLSEDEYARFHALNAAYQDRFGFPFIIAVRLAGGKAGILAAMERRLGHDAATERAAAMAEVGKIVRLRLEDELDKGLDALDARVAHDLETLQLGHVLKAGDTWVQPRTHDGGHVYDVIVIGGGQSGLGAAYGLKRERISNILVLDECPQGLEGPWLTYARMITLRTPKHLTAIDYGVPSLTFRAFWEARCGIAAWDALDKIPRGDWMAYLRWFRRVLDLPVVNDTRVERIEPLAGSLYRLHTTRGVKLARKVVLATGIQGGGEWHVPPQVADHLPKRLYAHTAEAIDYAALKDKRIALIGAGASSFDNAQYALNAGVAEAHVFVRRQNLPRINPIRHMEAVSLLPRIPSLPDADKYAVISHFLNHAQPPTNDTFARAKAMPGFRLHLGAPLIIAAAAKNEAGDDEVVLTTPQGTFRFDFLVVSTGLVSDPALRPELQDVADGILRWGDVYRPPEGLDNPLLDAHPYLGEGFALKGRDADAEARLHGLFVFNYSALASFGLSAAALSGLKHALPRLSAAVADQLFADDRAALLNAYFSYADEEFVADRETS